MSQLLMTAAASCGLGLCPIGGVDQAPLRDSFGLTKSLEQLSVEKARSMLEAKRAEAVLSGKGRTPDQV
jgi:nitroreductase